MRLLSLLLLFCLPLAAYPAILQAEARASNEQQAKRDDLAALADSILVNVQSEFSSYVEGNGKRQDELRIRSRSDVPKQYQTEAVLMFTTMSKHVADK